MHRKFKQKWAFSLAEALITLTIVAIITAVSIPVISKKKTKVNEANIHGTWTCANIGGRHVSKMTINGTTTTKTETSYCTFLPPSNASNFVVKVIGGGGGGAAGTMPEKKMFTYSSSYRVPETAEYIVAVVGGGGAGGGVGSSPCQLYSEITQGGGSGGWYLETITLKEGSYCTIVVGSGGTSSGASGGTSKFRCEGYNFEAKGGTAGRAKVKWHHDGGASHSDYDYCDWEDNGNHNGAGGTPGGVSGTNGNYTCTSCAGRITNSRLLKFIGGSTSLYSPGNGARPVSFSGQKGKVSITRNDVGAGGAGDPGAAVVKAFPKLNRVEVTIGTGGRGATTNGDSGQKGNTTYFGNLITAIGGNGGEAKYYSVKESKAKGQNALTPEETTNNSTSRSYGGYAEDRPQQGSKIPENDPNAYPVSSSDGITGAGSGGGGGGASMDEFGKGANGANGAVIVEW